MLPITKTSLTAKLLPSYTILRSLYSLDKIELSPTRVHLLVNKIAQSEAPSVYLDKNAGGNYKDLMMIAQILSVHSNGSLD